MRKLSIGLLTFALAATVFTSCKKDENAAPEITFANIDTTVYETTTDPYVLGITVTSEAGLKEVKISETKNGTTTTPVTVTDFPDESNYQNQYSVSGIPAGGITILVSATDKDDQNVTREIKITKKAVVTGGEINPYTGLVMGSSDNSNGSYLDAETGTVYKSGALTESVKPLIDLVYETDKLYNTSNLTSLTGAKFAETSITAAEFDAATTDVLFSSLTASLDNIAVAKDKIIFFITKGGKKGLVKITDYTAGKAGQITINEKIQK